MKTVFEKLNSTYVLIEKWVLVTLFLTMFIAIILQVITRYVLNYPLSWSEELARYLFVYIVFIGSALLFREKGHIALTFLVDLLPRFVQKLIQLSIQIIIFIVLFQMMYWGVKLTLRMSEVPTVALQIPWAIVYAVIPVSGFVMAFSVIGQFISTIRGGATPQPADQTLIHNKNREI